MSRLVRVCALLVVSVGIGCSGSDGCSSDSGSGDVPTSAGTSSRLPAPSEFGSIDDEAARSRAIFEAIGDVLRHPRCVNCHPAGDQPSMGDESRPHQPLVTRGAGGMGTAGMRCTSCHGDDNYRNVPGKVGWRLAPAEMAWEGKRLDAICRQLKDRERNGDRSLDELVDHMAEDPLIAYGWAPPEQYEPVPGTQEQLGKLARAWVDSGAHCPSPSESE